MDLTSPTPAQDSADGATQGMPLKDLGSFVHTSNISDAEIKEHRSADTVYVGLHLPRQRHRHRKSRQRHGHHNKPQPQDYSMSEGHSRPGGSLWRSKTYNATPPSQHVQFLLGEDENDEDHKTHDLFCELGELFQHDGEMEWKETARWIKFEEDVEEGGERWSKPHVATLSLHSLFELRSCLHNGAVILDMEVMAFYQVIDLLLDHLVAGNQLEEMLKDQVRDVLLQRHRHLNEKHEKKHHEGGGSRIHLPIIRSLADIGRKYSLPKEMHKEDGDETGNDADTGESTSTPADDSVVVAEEEETVDGHGLSESGGFDHDIYRPLNVGHHPHHGGRKCSKHSSSLFTSSTVPTRKKKLTSVKTMPNMNHHLPKNNSSPKLDQASAGGNGGHNGASASTSNMLGIKRNQSSGADLQETPSSVKLNMHFMKKIPPGSEAANILVGEVDFLNHQIVAFIRLKNSMCFGDLTEVPVPTKFIYIMLGPLGNQGRFHEIGRSMATLMTDEIFHDVAYHAHKRDDLLAGIDEFLDQVTVLPPGEWDPSIRIEPPKSVPSQEGRKTGEATTPLPNGKVPQEEEEESHGDDVMLQRTGRLFGGLIDDIKRKAPFYVSDFKDAFHVQSLASFMFLYFACLTPIITFGGLLADATKNDLGALESLLAGAIVGIVYALCAGQPLTILGSTGPVLVFETILYNFCKDQEWYYLSFRWWVGLWTGLILIIMVMFDLSALVRYITRFTEESFAALISLIFIKEAIGKLLDIRKDAPVNLNPDVSPFHDCFCIAPEEVTVVKNVTNSTDAYTTVPTAATTVSTIYNITTTEKHWHKIPRAECVEHGGSLIGDGCEHVADVFFLSCLLFIFTFVIAYVLKGVKNGRFFPTWVRTIISDFAVIIAIGSMVGIDAIIGLETPKLLVPQKFQPTNHLTRGWFIPPFHEKNPNWLCVAAVIPALLATILLFMDQQITAVIVNRKENKLKKSCGYHLDLLIVAVLIIVNSILGLPFFVAATVLSINHVMSLKKESTCTAPGERPAFLGVREQRVTGVFIFFMIGLSVFLTSVLKHIPMAVLYGVFLFMGVSSLKGMQLVSRITIMFMPMKYQPDYAYLRHVRVRRIHIFTMIQAICLAMLWVIKTIKVISIAFPIMVLAMCFIRKSLDWVFTQHELKWLDDIMPESKKREDEDKEKLQKDGMQEHEALLDPKCSSSATGPGTHAPKPSIVDLAINGGHNDSFVNQVNITEEMTRCSIWKNLQSTDPNLHASAVAHESSHGHSDRSNGSGKSSRSDLVHYAIELLALSTLSSPVTSPYTSPESSPNEKHKKRHKKDSNHHGHGHSLPTIPSSPTEKEQGHHKSGSRKGGAVAFYIDEEESDKDSDHMDTPHIVVDPPSDTNSMNC